MKSLPRGRVAVVAVFRNHEQLPGPRPALVVELHHRAGATEVFDVDEAGLHVVQGVHDVDDAERVRASPIDDLSADGQVDVLGDRPGQVGLAAVDLPLVDVEDGGVEVPTPRGSGS